MNSYTFENANQAFPRLLNELICADVMPSRNGTTTEQMMVNIKLTDPFPAEITTPGRKVALPAQIAEVMWLLAGRNDIEWLSHYLPRAKDFSDDGKTWRGGYGPRIRRWTATAPSGRPWNGRDEVDQLSHVVNLLKTDPDTRRAFISIYNPEIDTAPGKDVPCNDALHFIARDGKLNLNVFTRSNDLMWGWSGINSFEWSILLQIVAGLTELEVGALNFNISSLHLYEQHWGKAVDIVKANYDTEPKQYAKSNPRFAPGAANRTVEGLDNLVGWWFEIEEEIRTFEGSDWGKLATAVETFPEPMMRSWLRVLLAWHADSLFLAEKLLGTSLYAALLASPKKKKPVKGMVAPGFVKFVSNLHAEKHEAYGHSWCKRGEMLGIMANLARKVDRLGVSGAGDTSADTAIDLLVYLVKYRLWLVHPEGEIADGEQHAADVAELVTKIGEVDQKPNETTDYLIAETKLQFDRLEPLVADKREGRWDLVSHLITLVHPLALRLWAAEEAEKQDREDKYAMPQKVMMGVDCLKEDLSAVDWSKVPVTPVYPAPPAQGLIVSNDADDNTAIVINNASTGWTNGPVNDISHGVEDSGVYRHAMRNQNRRFDGYNG